MTNKINIKDLLPFLKDGWVAMDKDGRWFWFQKKPEKLGTAWVDNDYENCLVSEPFNIEEADNWEESLIKCGEQTDLKLEVGKFYRTRNGGKAIVIYQGAEYIKYNTLVCILNEPSTYRVTKNGLINEKQFIDRDLISEWEE